MIREAVADDLSELLRMGQAFFAATAFGSIGMDGPSAEMILSELIENPAGVLLVADRDGLCGFAGALVYPFYFNRKHITAQELFWWIDPPMRSSGVGRDLLQGLEIAVQKKGAQSLTMIALDEIDGPRVGELYQRSGYVPSERNFLKVF